jgi:transposase
MAGRRPGPAAGLDHFPGQGRELRGQLGGGFVAALLGEQGVATHVRDQERADLGPVTTGALLVTAGDNPQRLRNDARFAMPCGSSPIQASSGKTVRHRLM